MNVLQEMRPSDSNETMLLLREECGVEFFLNESSAFVAADCPACGAPRSQAAFRFHKYGFRHVVCPSCSTLYVSPRPDEGQLAKYYATYKAPIFWNEVLSRTAGSRKKTQYMPRLNKLTAMLDRHGVTKGCFVDMGAGNGNFTLAVAQSGLFDKTVACDISPHCIALCESLGLRTMLGTARDFDDDSIDCVSLNDIIEHLFDPAAFLRELKCKMRAGGMIFLATPNGEGFDFKLLNDKTDNITPPEHLQYFNPRSIATLLQRTGFQPVDVTTPGILDVDIVKRHRNERGFPIGQSNAYLDHLLAQDDEALEASLQQFLIDNSLSSHMLAFAVRA